MAFGLTELILAGSMGILTSLMSNNLLIHNLTASERIESLEQQRNSWSRTTGFIDAELVLSERVIDDPTKITISPECNINATEFRLALDLRRDLPLVIYGVKEADSGWNGDNLLWRCGPSINDDGSYNAVRTSDPMIDGLDGGATGGGFNSEAINNKMARYTLAIKGKVAQTLEPLMNGHTRISPLFTRPSDLNLCGAANLVKLSGDSTQENISIDVNQIKEGEDILICGFGGGDTIKGSWANDILECGSSSDADTASCTLWGGDGNDVLRGGHGDDILHGDKLEATHNNSTDSNNILIGGDGNDTLNGGDGKNQYLSGNGDDDINGGAGLDIVFYAGNKNEYSLSGCSKSNCKVIGSENEGEDTLTSVEILIFNDARIDLP